MSDGALVERERFGADVSSDAPALLGPRPDMVLLNDDYLTYAKVGSIGSRGTSSCNRWAGRRPRCRGDSRLNTARDMVRDAELSPVVFLDMVQWHVTNETDLAAVQGVLQFAH